MVRDVILNAVFMQASVVWALVRSPATSAGNPRHIPPRRVAAPPRGGALTTRPLSASVFHSASKSRTSAVKTATAFLHLPNKAHLPQQPSTGAATAVAGAPRAPDCLLHPVLATSAASRISGWGQIRNTPARGRKPAGRARGQPQAALVDAQRSWRPLSALAVSARYLVTSSAHDPEHSVIIGDHCDPGKTIVKALPRGQFSFGHIGSSDSPSAPSFSAYSLDFRSG